MVGEVSNIAMLLLICGYLGNKFYEHGGPSKFFYNTGFTNNSVAPDNDFVEVFIFAIIFFIFVNLM